MFRVGIGFDIHKFVKGRKLVLGGVEIPFSRGLLGNSDADVVLHAVADAVLGALGKGDIGDYFKDSVYKKKKRPFPSRIIAKKVLSLAKKEKAFVVNIDIVIILDRPRLLRYKRQILESLSKIFSLAKTRINLKIKSQEGIFKGEKENIMCLATALISYNYDNL